MKKALSLALCLLLCIGLLAGCGGSGGGVSDNEGAADYMGSTQGSFADDMLDVGENEYNEESGDYSIPDSEGDVNQESSNNSGISRKLITTYNISAETQKYDEFVEWIEKFVSESKGYLETSSDNSWSEHRSYNCVVRVPVDSSDSFLASLEDTVNIRSKSTQTDDVTLQYSDIEASIESVRIEQKNLQGMLEKAETIDDIIRIEDRLSTVRQTLESYESRLKVMDNQIEYVTIYLDVSEVGTYTEPVPDTWWGQAVSGFLGNCEGVIEFFKQLSLFIIVNIPWFVLIGILIGVILLATRKGRMRRKEFAENQKRLAAEYRNQQAAQGDKKDET